MSISENVFFYMSVRTDGAAVQRKSISYSNLGKCFSCGFIVGMKSSPFDRYYIPSELVKYESMGGLEACYLMQGAITTPQEEKPTKEDEAIKDKLIKATKKGCILFTKPQKEMYDFLNSDCGYREYALGIEKRLRDLRKDATNNKPPAKQEKTQPDKQAISKPVKPRPEAPKRDYEKELLAKDSIIEELKKKLEKAQSENESLEQRLEERETDAFDKDNRIQELEDEGEEKGKAIEEANKKVEKMGEDVKALRAEIERLNKTLEAYKQRENAYFDTVRKAENTNKARDNFKKNWVGKGKQATIAKKEGALIQSLRAQGMTIENIASILGHSPTTISKVLKDIGDPKPKKSKRNR